MFVVNGGNYKFTNVLGLIISFYKQLIMHESKQWVLTNLITKHRISQVLQNSRSHLKAVGVKMVT